MTIKSSYSFGNRSDIGMVRDTNQDYFGKYSGDFGQLIIVCDGMGGYAGGEIASQTAVEAIANHFNRLGHMFDEKYELSQSILQAQMKIDEQKQLNPELPDMGTTAVVLLIKGQKYWYAWVGDSRLYLVRGDRIQKLSKDHSYVQGLVDHGLISEDEAIDHPQRSRITRALGAKDFSPDCQGPLTLYKGDKLMLCSDGLYEYFKDSEILSYMKGEPQEACNTMVEIAKQRGGDDNITIQIVRADTGDLPPKAEPKQEDGKPGRLGLVLLIVSILLFLVVAGAYIWMIKDSNKQPEATKTIIKIEDSKSEEDGVSSKEIEPVAGKETEETTDNPTMKPDETDDSPSQGRQSIVPQRGD
jgi:protein phosphatase